MLHYLVCVDFFSSHLTRSLEAKVFVLLFYLSPAFCILCGCGRTMKQLDLLKSF
ncbi:hypothetical protein Fmac_029088 [Flemingia macrophylla]|uniref:Uncharacterized protein n=1 Tax=Flemingia macrophylla TaxID=520843 RepID=A0ABD1L9C3_9FABA